MKKVWVFVVVGLLLSLYIGSCRSKSSTEGKPVLPEQYLYVTIDENGEMVLNQKPVTFAELKEELAKRREAGVRTGIIITQAEPFKVEMARDGSSGFEPCLYLTIDDNGEMALNQKPVTFDNLKEEMAMERARLDDPSVIVIQTPVLSQPDDESALRDQVARVMGIARQIGVTDLILATPSKGK